MFRRNVRLPSLSQLYHEGGDLLCSRTLVTAKKIARHRCLEDHRFCSDRLVLKTTFVDAGSDEHLKVLSGRGYDLLCYQHLVHKVPTLLKRGNIRTGCDRSRNFCLNCTPVDRQPSRLWIILAER